MIIKLIFVLMILISSIMLVIGSFNSLCSLVTANKTEGTVTNIINPEPGIMGAVRVVVAVKDAKNPDTTVEKNFVMLQFPEDTKIGTVVKVWYWGKNLADVQWKNMAINNEKWFYRNLVNMVIGCGAFLLIGAAGCFFFSTGK